MIQDPILVISLKWDCKILKYVSFFKASSREARARRQHLPILLILALPELSLFHASGGPATLKSSSKLQRSIEEGTEQSHCRTHRQLISKFHGEMMKIFIAVRWYLDDLVIVVIQEPNAAILNQLGLQNLQVKLLFQRLKHHLECQRMAHSHTPHSCYVITVTTTLSLPCLRRSPNPNTVHLTTKTQRGGGQSNSLTES